MAAFRILNQAPQYLLATGKVNAGGRLYYYETDLTTPKNTWSDPDLTVLNSNPVLLDAAGRTLTDVWGDGEYGVVLTNSLDVPIWTRNNVRADGDPALDLPELGEGEVWIGDGAGGVTTTTISQLPDMTGEAGNILFTDGQLAYWGALVIPEPPDPEIVITTTPNKTARIGTSESTTKKLDQFGSDTVAPSGTKTVTKSVVFPTAFSATPWFIGISPTSGPATDSGAYPTWSVTSKSTTGFTVTFNIPDDDSNANWQISNTIAFDWKAEGTVIVS